MNDPTEAIRRERLAEINAEPGSREALEAEHGQVWDTEQLTKDFEVIGFLGPVRGCAPQGGRREGVAGVPAQPRPSSRRLPTSTSLLTGGETRELGLR